MIEKYKNIINLEHHISINHPQMSIEARSAQFAPFAALTGYNDEVKETARLTSERIELDDAMKLKLNDKLTKIIKDKCKDEVTITYFVKDDKKKGGKYVDYTGVIRTIDDENMLIIMQDKVKIKINDIINIK